LAIMISHIIDSSLSQSKQLVKSILCSFIIHGLYNGMLLSQTAFSKLVIPVSSHSIVAFTLAPIIRTH